MEENKELQEVEKTQKELTEDEKEIAWIKENNKWSHKAFAVIAASVAVFIWIIGLIFGTVVEATLFQEIAKWVVGGIAVGVLVSLIFYGPVEMMKLARCKYYPIYGKRWFVEAWKKEISHKK